MRLKLTFISKTFIKKKISPHGKFKVLLGALAVKKLPAYAGDISDAGLIPRLGRSPGEGHGNPLQYSCLKNPGRDWAEKPGRLQSKGSQRVGHD